MPYIVIDVFLLFFFVFALFGFPTLLGKIIFVLTLVAMWLIYPSLSYFFIKRHAINTVKSACNKSSDARLEIENDIWYLNTNGKKYKIHLLPTKYRPINLEIQNNSTYTRQYYFSIFGKVKLNLPFTLKSKPKKLPELSDDYVNCLLFIKEPLSLTYVKTNKPEPVFDKDEVLGFSVYTVKGLLNIITGEYK